MNLVEIVTKALGLFTRPPGVSKMECNNYILPQKEYFK